MSVFSCMTWFGISLCQKKNTKIIMPHHQGLLITREFEDEQRPVLVSAHPPLKIR